MEVVSHRLLLLLLRQMTYPLLLMSLHFTRCSLMHMCPSGVQRSPSEGLAKPISVEESGLEFSGSIFRAYKALGIFPTTSRVSTVQQVTMPSSVVTETASSNTQSAADAPATETGPAQPKDDFFWAYTEEPHKTRRLQIIKAHPEVWLLTLWSLCTVLTRRRF